VLPWSRSRRKNLLLWPALGFWLLVSTFFQYPTPDLRTRIQDLPISLNGNRIMNLPFWRRRQREEDLNKEIESHLDMAASERTGRGESPAEARHSARREFGSADLVREVTRDQWGRRWLEHLLQDVRYGLRVLRKSPGFTAVAVLTLALGIGPNTAIFSVVNAVLLRPLPYPHSERLVWTWGRFQLGNQAAVSPLDFRDYRTENHVFEHFAAFAEEVQIFNLTGGEKSVQVHARMVTTGFLEAFGVSPLQGRTFHPIDEQAAEPRVVILSEGFWRRHFAGNNAVVGSTLALDGRPVTVVGIAPDRFKFLEPYDLWFPAPFLAKGMQTRKSHFLRPVGLVKSGVSLAQAQSELDTIARRLETGFPDSDRNRSLLVVPLSVVLVGSVQPALLALWVAVALVLLIACANVANLFLTHATARRKEAGIRISLGAGAGRLTRQWLAESMMIALAGGGLGVLAALWGMDALRSFAAASVPRAAEVHLDSTTLLFTLALSLLTGLLLGIVPALQWRQLDLREALSEGGNRAGDDGRRGLRGPLVVTEFALALMLLTGAGLVLKSVWNLLRVNPGFQSENVLTTRIVVPTERYPEPSRRMAFYDQLMEHLTALPGVEAVGAVSELPLSGQLNDTFFTPQGFHGTDSEQRPNANFRIIMPGYFSALNVAIFEGRGFNTTDSTPGKKTVIINEPLAHAYFPNESPIGKHVTVWEGSSGDVTREIVGVVGGIRHFALQSAPYPEMYVPLAQTPTYSSTMNIVIRTSRNPNRLSGPIRTTVQEIDPNEALGEIQKMDEIVNASTADSRLSGFLLGLFAALALFLASVGIYGVMSSAISQKTHEIGIRMALGAQHKDVLRLVLRQGLQLVLAGLALGVAASLGLTRFLAGLLFGVTATDPATFAGVISLLALVALAACYIPARRAAKVDPMVALRYE
jgi:putative ABC transport system permease protein